MRLDSQTKKGIEQTIRKHPLMTLQQVADRYGVSEQTVKVIRKKMGFPNTYKTRQIALKKIIDDHPNLTPKEIIKRFKTTYNMLRKIGIKGWLSDNDKEFLRLDMVQNPTTPVTVIAKRHGISVTTAYNYRRVFGIPLVRDMNSVGEL